VKMSLTNAEQKACDIYSTIGVTIRCNIVLLNQCVPDCKGIPSEVIVWKNYNLKD
jgi:hypothetical protein